MQIRDPNARPDKMAKRPDQTSSRLKHSLKETKDKRQKTKEEEEDFFMRRKIKLNGMNLETVFKMWPKILQFISSHYDDDHLW